MKGIKKLNEKYLQHLEDIKDSNHNFMVMLYFLHYKMYNRKCMIVENVPIKNSDFYCFLEFQKDYLKSTNKLFLDKYVLSPIEPENTDVFINIIEDLQKDQLFHRIVLAMEVAESYCYYDFIDYLIDNPYYEIELILKEHERLLAEEIQYVEDLEEIINEAEDLEDDWVKIYE